MELDEIVTETLSNTLSEATGAEVVARQIGMATTVQLQQGRFYATAYNLSDGSKMRTVDLHNVTGVSMEKGLFGLRLSITHADGTVTTVNTYEGA